MDTNFVTEMVNAFNLVMGSDINQETKATFLSHWNKALDERTNNPDSGRYEWGEDEPYDWNWCYFDSHDDALECLQACMHRAEICKSGYCEVASYYDKAGEYGEIKYPDWAHGWTLDDLQKAEIFECPKRRNKKWTIRFPEARRIKNGDDEVKEDSSFPFKYWDHFRIITENAIDADLAVMNLDMIIDYKGYCTIKDLYDVSYRFQDPGTTPKTEDTDENNNFGWTERGFAEIDPETDYVRLTKAPKLLTWQDKNKKED